MHFRGLTRTGTEDELEDLRMERLHDPSRQSQHGGLDETWTTNLKLALMAVELQGKARLTAEKLGASEEAGCRVSRCLLA